MRNTEPTIDARPQPVTLRRRALTIALWLLQIVVALQFAGGGWLKLSGAEVMVDMFATIGIGQWFRFVVGALEIAGAIGLLVPRSAGLAALGLCGLMLGAIATNLLVLDADSTFAVILLVLCAVIAWGRWPQLRDVVGQGVRSR